MHVLDTHRLTFAINLNFISTDPALLNGKIVTVENKGYHECSTIRCGYYRASSSSYLHTVPNPVFQQDNARPHIARITLACFEEADVTLLPWPPRSTDLSPIEHVWDIIGRRLSNLMRPPQTLEDLQHQKQVAWDEIPQEEIDNLINSMPRRVRECLDHHDGATLY
jgi:hypothetical protein